MRTLLLFISLACTIPSLAHSKCSSKKATNCSSSFTLGLNSNTQAITTNYGKDFFIAHGLDLRYSLFFNNVGFRISHSHSQINPNARVFSQINTQNDFRNLSHAGVYSPDLNLKTFSVGVSYGLINTQKIQITSDLNMTYIRSNIDVIIDVPSVFEKPILLPVNTKTSSLGLDLGLEAKYHIAPTISIALQPRIHLNDDTQDYFDNSGIGNSNILENSFFTSTVSLRFNLGKMFNCQKTCGSKKTCTTKTSCCSKK